MFSFSTGSTAVEAELWDFFQLLIFPPYRAFEDEYGFCPILFLSPPSKCYKTSTGKDSFMSHTLGLVSFLGLYSLFYCWFSFEEVI